MGNRFKLVLKEQVRFKPVGKKKKKKDIQEAENNLTNRFG